MHPDVQALLAVQADDLELYTLEDRLVALEPRLAALEKERGRVETQLARTSHEISDEEARHRDALGRTETHRALVERSQRAYESVTTTKEATAANTQLEVTKRMASDSERDAAQIAGRIGELRHQFAELEKSLADVDARQTTARTELDAERKVIEEEMAEARAKRTKLSQAVPRPMLTTYDKVRVRKRGASLVPLRGTSCSACDTMIPTQRRATMAATGHIEMCEGCGSLIYAA